MPRPKKERERERTVLLLLFDVVDCKLSKLAAPYTNGLSSSMGSFLRRKEKAENFVPTPSFLFST